MLQRIGHSTVASGLDQHHDRSLPTDAVLVRDALGPVRFTLGGAGLQVGAVLEHRHARLDLGFRWQAALVAIDVAIAFGIAHPGVRSELLLARSFFVAANCVPHATLIDGLTAGETNRNHEAVE